MPLQLPGDNPAISVMTQCWVERAILSGDLPHTGHPLTTTSSPSGPPVPPSSTSLKPSSSSSSSSPPPPPPSSTQTLSHPPSCVKRPGTPNARFKPNVFTQVRQLTGRCVLVLLLAVLFTGQPAMGKPWYQEKNGQIVFNTKICQPLSSADLQRLMGAGFDQKRTAHDSSGLGDMGSAGYQGDDPRVAGVLDSSDLIEEEKEWDSGEEEEEEWIDEREEDIYTDVGMVREEEEEVVERRTWLPRKKMLSRRVSSRGGSSGGGSSSENWVSRRHKPEDEPRQDSTSKTKTVASDFYPYMRRRRRRRSLERAGFDYPGAKHHKRGHDTSDNDDELEEDDDEEDEDGSESKYRKSRGSRLHLRLAINGRNKNLRKQLKKKFRQRARNSKKPPPWDCKMKHKTLLMKEGIYPTTLSDGVCETQKCFYRLYNCEPMKYAVKILKRDPERCNPLPTLSNVTEYEERWVALQYRVTVGCNCASVSGKRGKAKSRRRN